MAQLYLTDPAAAGEPPFQLKGIQKVTLAPGRASGSSSRGWVAAPGWYRVRIGSDERDLPVSAGFFAG